MEQLNFKPIPVELSQYIRSIREDFIPLLFRYGGLGYYYVFLEHVWTFSPKKYCVIMLGGSSEIDRENTVYEYKAFEGELSTLQECIKKASYLPEP